MSYLKSLPPGAALLQVFRAYPRTARPLLDFYELVMRDPSPFTVAERELMAAYVSAINGCTYCHGVHTAAAVAFGVPVGLLTAALTDINAAPVDERIRPVLRYRMVDGLGIQVDESYFATSADRLHRHGYAGLAATIEDRPPSGQVAATDDALR